MKTLAAIAFAAATALSLAACETTVHDHGDGGGYAYGYVDGYYDDAYGPWYDGYWGPDDAFYYRASPTGDYQRDTGNHFRHATAQGFHTFHSRAGRAPVAHG